MSDATPTAEDYASVTAAVESMERGGWRKATLNTQVDSWADLVALVEEGYSLTIDDYTNDLYVRGWLEEVRGKVSDFIAASLHERLAPLDDRFRAATTIPSGRMPGAGSDWWFRLPRVLIGELEEDAVRMGLVN